MTLGARFSLILAAILLGALLWHYTLVPSHDRDWAFDQKVLPTATIQGTTATVSNIRNFSYTSATSATPVYYDSTYDLAGIARTWYVVAPFGPQGVAHTFLSFEFENGEFLAVSVEARKEVGEVYSPLKGIFRVYELMYVLGSERDVIGTRALDRGQDVYVYPLTLSPEQSRTVLESILREVESIAREPQFYNTFTGSCMTGVAKHLAEAGIDVPLSWEYVLPAYIDRLFFELGLIDTEADFDRTKEDAYINDRAALHADSADFSRAIRTRE